MTNSEEELDRGGRSEATSLLASDEFYRALAARPRRRIMAYLLERDETTVDELAAVLCGWDASDEPMVDGERYELVRVELYHTHLPRLEDAGLVAYDWADGTVALGTVDAQASDLVRRSVEAES